MSEVPPRSSSSSSSSPSVPQLEVGMSAADQQRIVREQLALLSALQQNQRPMEGLMQQCSPEEAAQRKANAEAFCERLRQQRMAAAENEVKLEQEHNSASNSHSHSQRAMGPNFISLIIALILLLFVCNATPTSALSFDEHQYLYQCCVAQTIFRHKNELNDLESKKVISQCTDALCQKYSKEVLVIKTIADSKKSEPYGWRNTVTASARLPQGADPAKLKFFTPLNEIFKWDDATLQKLRTAISKYPDQQGVAKAAANVPNIIKQHATQALTKTKEELTNLLKAQQTTSNTVNIKTSVVDQKDFKQPSPLVKNVAGNLVKFRARKLRPSPPAPSLVETHNKSPMDDNNIWPQAIVPFQYDGNLLQNAYVNNNGNSVQVMQNYIFAIDHYRQHTCIRLQNQVGAPVTFYENNNPHTNGFGTTTTEVHTDVRQGTTVHELGHLIGFFHTMARQDRNNWVSFYPVACYNFYLNGICGRNANCALNWIGQYTQANAFTTTDRAAYDYTSIMHYQFDQCMSLPAGVVNQVLQAQININNGNWLAVTANDIALINFYVNIHNQMANLNTLSVEDVVGINQHYGCLQITVTSSNNNALAYVFNMHPQSTVAEIKREVEWRHGLQNGALSSRILIYYNNNNNAVRLQANAVLNQIVIGPNQVTQFQLNF